MTTISTHTSGREKILLLFDRASVEAKQADPKYLADLLARQSDASFEYMYAEYDDIAFNISDTGVSVTLMPQGMDISDFSLIYFRRFNADQARAQAVAMYAQSVGVPFVDSEIGLRKGSISKLTQYMKLALHGISIPATFTVGQKVFRELLANNSQLIPISLPYVMKIADATRGNANELIRSTEDALKFIDEHPEGEILLQEYIDNHGDYRVWVTGETLGPVFYRQRSSGGTHKNNTSQGASIAQVTDPDEINAVKDIALNAARLFNREIAGVDVVRGTDGTVRVFEVNRAPQVEHTQLEDEKGRALAAYLQQLATGRLTSHAPNRSIGVSSLVDFVGYKNLKQIPVRIDTGARTSSLWASDIKVKDGVATFKLFGPDSPWYTGKVVRRKVIELREVTSSTGHTQMRYVVNMSIRIHGQRLNAKFTLSDRSTQLYPILIGRNTLRGNFLVDSADPGEAKLYKYPEEAAEFAESETI